MTPVRQDIRADVRAVVLPVVGDALDEPTARFLRDGGRSVLLGETREEYVARRMSPERRARETREALRALVSKARGLAESPILVAVDQELAGIQRLHDLVSPLPTLEETRAAGVEQVQAQARETAESMGGLGINLNLAPILDVMSTSNPWLDGRHLGGDPEWTATIGAAFVKGMQSGGVAATAKHFPGNRGVREDPALEPASVPSSEHTEINLAPFRAAVNAGVEAVMTAPTVVCDIDAENPASLSPAVIALLRDRLGFLGVVISDDLDSSSVLRGRQLGEVGVRALQAGVDLLLIAGGPDLGPFCDYLFGAVLDGHLDATRVSEAAERVRSLAGRYGK